MKASHVRLIWVLVLLFITAACKDEQVITPESNAIQGQFISSDGSPLSNIIVEATDATGKTFSTFTTDTDGNFEIQNLPESNDNAIVSFINDNEVLQQLKLSTIVKLASEGSSPNNSKQVTILQGGDYDASFAVIVVDKTTQERVSGAVVTMATSANAALEATSDADGVALFEKIVPGKYTVRIQKDGYKFYEESMLLIFPDGVDKFEFEFEITQGNGTDPEECCNNIVVVKVTDIRGTPVPRESVVLHTENQGNRIEYTNEHGVAMFRGVCTSAYEVFVERPVGDEYRTPVRVNCEDSVIATIRLDIALPPPADDCCRNTLIVNLTDRNGKPFTHGLQIIATDANGRQFFTRTDTSSRAEFRNICKGDLLLKIEARIGGDPMVGHSDFGTVDNKNYEIHFTDCAQIEEISAKMDMDAEKDKDPNCFDGAAKLKFLKPNGEAWKNCTVRLWINSWGMAEYQTNDVGEALIYDLNKGDYQGIIELPDCNTEHRFHFSIECNASITKEFTVTCE